MSIYKIFLWLQVGFLVGCFNGSASSTLDGNSLNQSLSVSSSELDGSEPSSFDAPSSLSSTSQISIPNLNAPTLILDRTQFTFANWDLFTIRVEPVELASHYLVSIIITHASNSSLNVVENNIRVDATSSYFVLTSSYGRDLTGTPFFTSVQVSYQSISQDASLAKDSLLKDVQYVFNSSESKKTFN